MSKIFTTMCACAAIGLVLAGAGSVQSSAAAGSGLVAAYGFDEGSGTVLHDSSGNGNNGTLANTSWTAGRYGGALSFNGSTSMATVPGSATLAPTGAVTVEAWLRPAIVGSWQAVAIKEQSTTALSYGLYAGSDVGPAALVYTGSERSTKSGSKLPAATWSHVAAVYSGSTLSVYVNGVLKAQSSTSGAIAESSGALRIGGDSIWNEFFQGQIDELRIYNRALAVAEIQSDMSAAITVAAPDTQAPTTPTGLTAGATSQTSIALSWAASTDNVAVTGYGLYRSGSNVGTTTATNATISGLTCGSSYTLAVDATDAAGNRSGQSASVTASTTACAVAGATANLWIDGGTGSCTRSAGPVASNPATACSTPQAAMDAAQGGDLVLIQPGTYAGTFSLTSGTKTSTVTFRASGYAVPTSASSVLSSSVKVIYTGGIVLRSVDKVHIYGVSAAPANPGGTANQRAGGIDICDPRSSCGVNTDLLIDGFHGKSAFINGEGVTIDHSEFGNWDACATAADRSTEDAFRFWAGAPTVSQMANNTLQNSVVHDVIMGPNDSAVTSVCGLGSATGPHVDCMQNNGGNNIVVQGNIFYNCPTSDVQWDPFAGGTIGTETIQNNYFGPTACCNGIVIGTQGSDRCTGITIRYNIMYKGDNASTCPAGGPLVYGNLFLGSSTGCSGGVYSYNVFAAAWTGMCGTQARHCDAVFVNPPPRSFSLTNGPPDLRLAPGDTCAVGGGDPARYPATDAFGSLRPSPSPTAPDAGPYELP